jgi:hypothetical protein
MNLVRRQVHISFISKTHITCTTATKQKTFDTAKIKKEQVLDLVTLEVGNKQDYDERPNFILTAHDGFCAVSYRQYLFQRQQHMAMIRVGRFKNIDRDGEVEETNEGTFKIVLERV